MSRKLLMVNGKEVGFIYDKQFTSDKAPGSISFEEGENLTPAYSYGYLLEATAKNTYPGATTTAPSINYHTIAEHDPDSDNYIYTIVSRSADGTKTKRVNFRLPILIDEVDRRNVYPIKQQGVYSDRLYWDDARGEYMIEKRTEHIVFTDSTGWTTTTSSYDRDLIYYHFPEGEIYSLYTYDEDINEYDPFNTNFYKPSYTEMQNKSANSNYYTMIALKGGRSQNAGTLVITNYIQLYHNYGTPSYQLTTAQKDALFEVPMHFVYVPGVPGDDPINDCVTLIATGIKKKIKVPIFGEGSTFSLEHTDDLLDSTGSVIGEDTTYGSIKIDVPCTDAVVYEPFEGESITPSFSSDTHVFCEDEPIYLEEVNGVHYYARNPAGVTTATYNVHVMRTLGTPLDNGKYEYTVTATSADGTKTKDIKFAMDYQLLYYGTPNKMYWNDESGCYDVLMYTGYEYITNVDDFGTLKYSDYTIFTKETDDGKVAYDGGNSSGVYANGTFHQADRGSIYAYTHTVTNGSTENGYTIGLCIHDVHTAEAFNARIAENGPIHVFYKHNTEKIYHTDIKKKIELPWFGEGTTYTLKNGDLSSTFKIGLPTKYEHKITYKEYTSLEMDSKTDMTTTIQPTIKDLDVYDICYSYESYIDTIINPVRLYDGGGYDVAIDNGDGTYSYNIEGASLTINPDTGGAIITSLFTQEIKLPYYIDAWFQNTTYNGRDRFYWDDDAGQYMLEKNSMRIVIDSAYGDVEFKPFSYSSYSLNYGNCWEFALPDGCDAALINVGYSSQCRLNTNYQRSNMTTAYIYDDDGVIFHPDYHSTFENDKSLVFHYEYATTLDLLDQQLKTKPLILILPIPEPIMIPTGIKKKITLPLTQSMCEAGLYVTMKNTNSAGTILNSAGSLTHGILTIKVPVEYKTIEVPEPTYQLPAKTVLSGSSSGGYINTGVKLFDTAKDSTVIIDFQNVNASGSFTPDNGDIVFHCRYESSSYKYRGFALVYETTYNTWRMMGNTTYNSGNLGSYSTAAISNSSRETYCWRYRYAFIFKAGILDRAINLSAESISSIDIPAPAVFYDEELFADKAEFGTYSKTAYIGRKGTNSSNYYQGTIHDCKIWDGVALTDAQIQALYCGPYSKPVYTLTNHSMKSFDTLVRTDLVLLESKRDLSILLDFDVNSDNILNNKAYVATYGHYDYSTRLAITYKLDTDSYYVEYMNENALVGDIALPVVNGRCQILINYKAGGLDEVYDLSGEKPRSLAVKSTAKTPSILDFVFVLGYLPDTDDTATNRDPMYVWYGHINNCMVWYDKVVTNSELEYMRKYVLK